VVAPFVRGNDNVSELGFKLIKHYCSQGIGVPNTALRALDDVLCDSPRCVIVHHRNQMAASIVFPSAVRY
jgi:hypothetical protein